MWTAYIFRCLRHCSSHTVNILIIFVELFNENSYGNKAIDIVWLKLLCVDMEGRIVVQAMVPIRYYIKSMWLIKLTLYS